MQAIEALDLTPQNVSALGTDLLEQVILGHHMVDFWTNLCICHSLIVEDHPTLGKVYQVGAQPTGLTTLMVILSRRTGCLGILGIIRQRQMLLASVYFQKALRQRDGLHRVPRSQHISCCTASAMHGM